MGSGREEWARRTVATIRLSELTLCTNRWDCLRAADYPDVYSADEIADAARAADVYAEVLREERRACSYGHVCSRCSDVTA
jgi:hypothetical protein